MVPVRIAVSGTVAVLLLGGCAGGGRGAQGRPAAGGRRRPAVATASPAPEPDTSTSVHSLGQECSWQNGLTVGVLAVRRDGSDAGGQGEAGFSVTLRISNKAPVGYATDALQVGMSVGPDGQAAVPDQRMALGAGVAGKVASAGQTITGSYGFRLPSPAASNQITVRVRPSPVDQSCVFRGTAEPSAAS